MHAFITNFTNNQINIMMLTRLNIYYLMMIIITIDNWYQPDFRQVLHFFILLRHDEESLRNHEANQEIGYILISTLF